jgi:soluble lytic murein transglycosylase
VNELARRSDWRGLLAFSPEKPTSTEAQCNYYYAKLSVGQAQEAWDGAKALWLTGKSQPNACDRCLAPGALPASRIRWPILNVFAWR